MFDLLRQCACNSANSILANKARSFLTMLGIIIGVGAVILIMALGAGAQELILGQIESFGTNKIGILPGKSDDDGPPASAMGIIITSLKLEDAQAIKKEIPHVEAVAAYANDAASISWQSNSYSTNIKGVNEDYFLVEGGEIENGRFFTDREQNDLSKVVILGYTVKKEIFGESDPIGTKIKIRGNIFEVIGTTKERGTIAFQNYDDQVLVPIKTTQKIIAGINYINMIRLSIDNEKNIPEVMDQINLLLRDRHEINDKSGDSDDFSVRSSADAISMITTITNALKYFLAAMAALSLLVGGIGIMNIMLVSVTERTREIGLRKALGASSSNIINQFLIETISLTTIGGIIGIIGGVIVSYIVTIVIQNLGYDWKFSIPFLSIILGTGVSMIIGLIFGIYPASKASKLEPVEALRYE